MNRTLRISPDLSLPLDVTTQTIVVYGGKGMGKTNFGRVLVEELDACGQRFSVLDPVGVWYGAQYSADGKGAGLEVVVLGGLHGDIPIEPTGGAVVADLVADEDANVIVDISRRPTGAMWSLGERTRFVTDYATRLYERQGERRRPIMQVIDEAGRFVPQMIPHGAPEIAKCVGVIERLVEEGRNVGIGVCLITQRSARMNKSVSELAECMVAFRTVGPRSVDAILDWFGEHVEKSRWKALVESLRSLPRGRALVVSPGWLAFEGEVNVRFANTLDTSATPTGQERRVTGRARKPDLKKYEEKIAATIEKAKADDPRELRRRIAELEKQASRAKPAEPASALTDRQESLLKELRDEVSVIQAGGLKGLQESIDSLVKLAGDRRRDLGELAGRVDRIIGKLDATILNGSPPRRAEKLIIGKDKNVEIVFDAPSWKAFNEAEVPKKKKKGEFAILTAIAQNPDGVERNQISALTGYKQQTRDTYISRLVKRGLVEEPIRNEPVKITKDGMEALGPSFKPLPTGQALIDHWMGELPQGEGAVFLTLVKAWPDSVTRESLTDETGFVQQTRDTYISRLVRRKLVEKPQRGLPVRASEALMANVRGG